MPKSTVKQKIACFFIALFQKQMSEWSDTTKASSH